MGILLDEGDITKSSAQVTIEVASVDTDSERRDTYLTSPDFFEAEKFPSITFTSKRVEKTKEVRIPFELSGPVTQQGRKRIGVEGSVKVNRFDYGLKWNNIAEAVQVVGDSIRLDLNIAAALRPAQPAR